MRPRNRLAVCVLVAQMGCTTLNTSSVVTSATGTSPRWDRRRSCVGPLPAMLGALPAGFMGCDQLFGAILEGCRACRLEPFLDRYSVSFCDRACVPFTHPPTHPKGVGTNHYGGRWQTMEDGLRRITDGPTPGSMRRRLRSVKPSIGAMWVRSLKACTGPSIIYADRSPLAQAVDRRGRPPQPSRCYHSRRTSRSGDGARRQGRSHHWLRRRP